MASMTPPYWFVSEMKSPNCLGTSPKMVSTKISTSGTLCKEEHSEFKYLRLNMPLKGYLSQFVNVETVIM